MTALPPAIDRDGVRQAQDPVRSTVAGDEPIGLVALGGEAAADAAAAEGPLGFHLQVGEVIIYPWHEGRDGEGRVPEEADGIQVLESQPTSVGEAETKVQPCVVDLPTQGLPQAVAVPGVA